MCNRTMCRERRKSATVYITAAVILMCYLAQTIDCYRLKKTERRDGRREADAAKTIGVQEGGILFGIDLKTESQDTDGTKKSNASVEDEVAYQADSTGWAKGQTQDAISKEVSWRRMAPTLQCGGEQLKFRAVGPGTSHFAVEQVGTAPPMALSQIPSTCGYNMQRNSLGLVMMVPYDGCNMVQEGGSYVLPMRWQGIPVSLWCPKPAASDHPQTTKSPDVSHHIPPPAQVPHFPWFPWYPMVPTAAPTTTAKPATAPPPKFPFFYPQYPFHWHPPATAKPQTTTTAKPQTTTTAKPQLIPIFPIPPYPQVPMPFPQQLYPFFQMFNTPKPQVTTKPTTTTTPPQTQVYPYFFQPIPHYPQLPYFPNLPFFPTTTTPTTTTTTTATTPMKNVQQPQLPQYYFPNLKYPMPIPGVKLV